MTRSIRLRPWQKAAFDAFTASTSPDFLAVATPGAGKTTFALAAARHELGVRPGRLIVVAPTSHLKSQWAAAAHGFALHLDPNWSPSDGRMPRDLHGIVTTYQQVATAAPALRSLAQDAFVVLDELHHAADDKAWGDSARVAFEPARRRLALSGTPFRSDTAAIPFVRYQMDEACPDFVYGYGQALTDGRVVRPVYFPRTGGEMEWIAPDGSQMSATFDDALDNARASQRLRTALSLEGQWLPTVLSAAHERLTALRANDPDTGGLVIAIDQEHARGIARIMRWRVGVDAVVVTSDDPDASRRITRFAASDDPWMVAVRMVSEGVDIPRLSVGVFATTTTTELFFRQAVGRLVRWRRGARNHRAYFFIPDDPRLRARAHQIADERRHNLRKPDPARDAEPVDPALADAELDELKDPNEQLSLFAVISAVATGHADAPAPWDSEPLPVGATDDDDHGVVIEFADPPALDGPAPDDPTISRVELRRRLRDANAAAAKALARRTGWGHAKVNAELNRLSGIARVTEATAAQLERRLRHAETWLART